MPRPAIRQQGSLRWRKLTALSTQLGAAFDPRAYWTITVAAVQPTRPQLLSSRLGRRDAIGVEWRLARAAYRARGHWTAVRQSNAGTLYDTGRREMERGGLTYFQRSRVCLRYDHPFKFEPSADRRAPGRAASIT